MGSPASRIWVLPNRRTPGLAAVLAGMWYAGASQGNAAAYLLCFVILGVALVSALHTWANLRGLSVRAESIRPIFAGEDLIVPAVVHASLGRSHFALELGARARAGQGIATIAILSSAETARAELRAAGLQRGRYRELPVRLSSSFPLGFFTAQQHVAVRQHFHVYPAASGDLPLPRAQDFSRQPSHGIRTAGDDFGGVRVWQTGESQRHIDWKAAARSQALLIKQWTGDAEEILRLEWDALAPMEVEARLSQLAKWVVLAERHTAAYELHLPGKSLAAGRGDSHCHACLRALAEFTDPPENQRA